LALGEHASAIFRTYFCRVTPTSHWISPLPENMSPQHLEDLIKSPAT